ncbi:hypothetical protein M378DRAFT_170993 [Amanita muscaria Koide BX008]|uniref:Uncharacterized protein n=1 Tax=Amanita muscaria (strain Koide BX008) TaxID=946122 RepID=A0A0C2SVL5_AMAMK|nr:hypothetical protein M378DRAFT_170993 [Amanita muscaria Koide BX008]
MLSPPSPEMLFAYIKVDTTLPEYDLKSVQMKKEERKGAWSCFRSYMPANPWQRSLAQD